MKRKSKICIIYRVIVIYNLLNIIKGKLILKLQDAFHHKAGDPKMTTGPNVVHTAQSWIILIFNYKIALLHFKA